MNPLHSILFAIDTGLLVLIWTVQVSIYPGFRKIPGDVFIHEHRRHTQKMGYVAGPLMVAQLGLSSLILAIDSQSIPSVKHFTLVVSTWLITFFVSVPLHRKLQKIGKSSSVINSLVFTNWIRTAIWSFTFLLSLTNMTR